MKKTILALLLSQSAFALEPMFDNELSQVEGQSGITIETQLHDTSTIGEISYTDHDGNGTTHTDSAGVFLSDISFGPSSMKMDMDVTAEGTLNIDISNIVQGDLWVRSIALGDSNSSIGALGVTDFNYDPLGSYNVQFTGIDPNSEGINKAAIVLNFNLRNSSFKVTYIDEAQFDNVSGTALSGNAITYTTQFDQFLASGTTIFADDSVSDDGSEWIRVNLGSISGSAEFQNISFGTVDAANSTPSTVAIAGAQSIGTAGFSNVTIENNSFIAISAH